MVKSSDLFLLSHSVMHLRDPFPVLFANEQHYWSEEVTYLAQGHPKCCRKSY